MPNSLSRFSLVLDQNIAKSQQQFEHVTPQFHMLNFLKSLLITSFSSNTMLRLKPPQLRLLLLKSPTLKQGPATTIGVKTATSSNVLSQGAIVAPIRKKSTQCVNYVTDLATLLASVAPSLIIISRLGPTLLDNECSNLPHGQSTQGLHTMLHRMHKVSQTLLTTMVRKKSLWEMVTPYQFLTLVTLIYLHLILAFSYPIYFAPLPL